MHKHIVAYVLHETLLMVELFVLIINLEMNSMDKVLDGLYISDCFAASDKALLVKNVGFRFVITIPIIENYSCCNRG